MSRAADAQRELDAATTEEEVLSWKRKRDAAYTLNALTDAELVEVIGYYMAAAKKAVRAEVKP